MGTLKMTIASASLINFQLEAKQQQKTNGKNTTDIEHHYKGKSHPAALQSLK